MTKDQALALATAAKQACWSQDVYYTHIYATATHATGNTIFYGVGVEAYDYTVFVQPETTVDRIVAFLRKSYAERYH